MSEIEKVGMYSTDEILEFMTEGEGRGFLGRSMYDAIMEEINKRDKIIKEAREYHDNCVNNLLDIEKIDEPQKLAYQVAYEIHKNYLEIIGSDKE